MATGRGPRRAVRALGPSALVAVGLFAVLFLPELLRGRVFAFRDVANYHLPIARVVGEELRAGRFPAWNPWIACGTPLAANPNHYALYPSRALDLALAPETAMQVHLLGHWALGGLATAGLALLLGASSAGAAAAAAVFLLAGPVLSLLNFANLVPFLAWIPWIAAAAVALGRRPGRRRAALLAGTLAVPATFAEPSLLLVTVGAVLAVVAYDDARPPGALVRALPWAAAALAVALLLAAPAWGPAARLVAGSARAADVRADLGWSVRPLELLHLGIPQLFGDYHTLEKRTWWNEVFHAGKGPFFLSLALGSAALAIGAAGVASRGRRGLVLVAAGLVALALAMGAWLEPVRALAFSEAGRWLRWPVKLTVLPAVLLPLAVARGVDAIAAGERRAALAAMAAGAGLAAVAFGVAASFGDAPAAWVRETLLPLAGAKDIPAILAGTQRTAIRSGAAALGVALLAGVAWGRGAGGGGWRRVLAPGLLVLVLAEMVVPQRAVNRGTPRDVLRSDPPILAEARAVAADARRVHFPVSHWDAGLRRREGMPDEWWPRVAFDRELGNFYHPIGARIPMVLVNPDRLVSRGAAERARIAGLLAAPDRARLLRLIGASGEVRITYAALETGQPVHATLAGWPVSLAVDADAVPIAHRAPAVDPPLDAAAWTGPFVRAWEEAIRAARAEGGVEVVARTPGRWRLATDGPAAGRIGLTVTRSPGWRARVDGRPARIEPYLADFMAVRVPAGAHTVEWSYRTPGAAAWITLSALGLAVALALARPDRRPARASVPDGSGTPTGVSRSSRSSTRRA